MKQKLTRVYDQKTRKKVLEKFQKIDRIKCFMKKRYDYKIILYKYLDFVIAMLKIDNRKNKKEFLTPQHFRKGKNLDKTYDLIRIRVFDKDWNDVGDFTRSSYDMHHRWIDPKYRGLGVGRACVKIIEDDAKKAGHKIMYTSSRVRDNIGFLAKFGYEISEDQKITVPQNAKWRFKDGNSVKKYYDVKKLKEIANTKKPIRRIIVYKKLK